MAQTTFRPASKAASSKSTPAPASSRENKEKKTISNDTTTMPLGTINYVLMGVSLLLIVVGFALMSGSGNTGSEWNPDIFASRRIVVAPLVTFLGFILMAPAILWRKKADRVPVDAVLEKTEETTTTQETEAEMGNPMMYKIVGYVLIALGVVVITALSYFLYGLAMDLDTGRSGRKLGVIIALLLGGYLIVQGVNSLGKSKKSSNDENKS